jgi:hypothetical protein
LGQLLGEKDPGNLSQAVPPINYDEIRKLYEACIRINRDFKEAYILLAELLTNYNNPNQDVNKAMEYFQKACK